MRRLFTGIASDKAQMVDGIIDDAGEAVGSITDAIRGNQSIIAAASSLVNTFSSVIGLVRGKSENEDGRKRICPKKNLPQGKKMINIFIGGTKMKATGIVRPVDPLGRVVIPVELRRTLGIKTDDSLEVFVDGDYIMLRKVRAGLYFLRKREGRCIRTRKECLQRLLS